MQNPWRFTLKFFFAFAISSVLFIAAVTFVLRDEEIGWGVQYLEYKHHYAAQIGEPKIIFNGGCATLYGIRSSIAQQATGFRAVNLGVSGGFSPTFHMDQFTSLMKKGDVIVYMPEYEAYGDNQVLQKYDFQYYRIHDPEKIRALPATTIFEYLTSSNVIDSFTYTLTNQIRSSVRGSNQKPSDLTEQGDYDVCESVFAGESHGGNLPTLTQDSNFLRKVKEFSELAKAMGVKFIFGFPPTMFLPAFDTPEWLAKSRSLRDILLANGINVVGEPRTSVSDRSQFCNTEYHLNKHGAVQFTEKLLSEIRPLMASASLQSKTATALP